MDLMKENRSLGFVSLEDCKNIPPHTFARLMELRAAKASGKPAPAPSRFYIAEAEKRGLLTLPRAIERKLFPVRRLSLKEFFRNNVPKGMSLEEHLDATEMRSFRARAQKQATVIAAAAPKKLSAEEQRAIDTERRRCFPMEYCD
jgi:hypothetical protein